MPTILNDLKCMSTIEKLKLLLRCVIFIACSCALSTMLHAFDSAFIQDVHGKPSFVSDNLMFFSILERTSFVIAYIILGYQLPIKNHVLRGFTYMMLICISNYLPQVMGLAGADSEIAEVAFGLSIIICDCLGYVLSGILLGILFNKIPDSKKRPCNQSTYTKTILASAIGFPIIIIIVDQLVALIHKPFSAAGAMDVSDENKFLFYIIFYGCFIVSGIFIAIFYRMTEYNKASDYGWLLFGLKYSLLIWSPIVLIMIAFGTDILTTVVYTFIFIFCITAISWVNGRLLKE